jgi:hypothetical protein
MVISRHQPRTKTICELTEQLEITLLAIKLVKADIRLDRDTRAGITEIRIVAGDDTEAFAPRLPREVEDGVLELDDLHRAVLLPHTEHLEITEDGLLGLCVTVDLDAEEVALVLPVELTL